jgi:phosphohistidine phosphatase SixA
VIARLHLLRHAHAGNAEAWPGSDEDRPLSPKGRRQASRLANFLRDVELHADALISSPKLRARETAEPVAAALGLDLRIDDRLAGGGLDARRLAAILEGAGDPDAAILVGHDPDLSDLLVELLASEGISMRKGALARIDVEVPFVPGTGRLRWLVTPDLLDPAL